MNTSTLLHQMCHTDLAKTDIKAIGKNRNFKPQEFATPTMLESIYLSAIGIEKVMATLTPAEITMLHLLHIVNEPVTVDWFERLYNPDSKSSYYHHTYTQRYQPIFKQVRTQLVRKGILIMGQKQMVDATKMEQWRFIFPQEFTPYLPLPTGQTKHLATSGKTLWDVSRKKLLTLTGETPPPKGNSPGYEPALKDGQLFLGKKPYTLARLQEWQTISWQASTPKGKHLSQSQRELKKQHEETPLSSIQYIFGLLPPDEWIQPNQLDHILKIFCLRNFKTEDICKMGWLWGYLAKNSADGHSYYHLAGAEVSDGKPPKPADYLSASDEKKVEVDLHTIPYLALEQLNQVAFLQIDKGRITAVPHLIRMGEAPPAILTSPLMAWLQENCAAFAQAKKTINTRWGKQLVHTNLHVARIKDLALRIKITQTLKPHECISLSDEYIAFPPKLLSKVTRLVEQAGHVVKKQEG